MSAVHGKNTVVKIDDSGGTLRDITNQVTQSSLNRNAQEIDVTAYADTSREYILDFPDAMFNFEGNAAATVMGYLHGILGQDATVSVEYGPEGSGTGKRKFTFEGRLTQLNESGQAVGSQNKFTAAVRVTGAITLGTYS